MYARTVTVQVKPGMVEETQKIYNESVVPAARQQKGFKGIMLLTDANTGKGISIVLWETEADMRASESSGYLQQQLAKFGALLAAPPVTERYEVAAQAM